MSQLIHRIILKELLSFDEQGIDLELRPLNVLIGPNGSGKSNLIEAISLFQATSGEMARAFHGGISGWLWKGKKQATASIEAIVHNPLPGAMQKIRHNIRFTESNWRFEIVDERIEDEFPRNQSDTDPYFFYRYQNNHPVLNVKGEDTPRALKRESIDPGKSILAQRSDPDQYPEITYLANIFREMRFYQDWIFGRNSPPRQAQETDLKPDFLEEDYSNLAIILSSFRRDISVKQEILEHLKKLNPEIHDFDISVQGGKVQIFLHEGNFSIPANRLSDGTLRYLCLLSILCHPNPPPLICIDEPELGLHPDALVAVGKLLKEASQRTQLIVTTHSDILIDCMSDSPEDVIVCEKQEGASQMRRLDKKELEVWLEDYSLGQLWTKGEIGGNLW